MHSPHHDAPTLARSEPPALLGRAEEQATLLAWLTALDRGQGGLVLLAGEAGIGKTALATWLATVASQRDVLVLRGQGYELTERPPYDLWRDLLAPIEGTASLLHPGPGGQSALFTQIWDWFAGLSRRQPILLVLDDLHWADTASLELLRSLARRCATAPILILGTFRADELDDRHPFQRLLPPLVRETHAARLALGPLDSTALRGLLRARYALPPPDEDRLLAALTARADGNPLFVTELLRAYEEAHALVLDPNGWRVNDLAASSVPPLLRGLIAARLARLPEADWALLGLAAVIGPAPPLDVWRAIGAVSEEALLAVIERAVVARLLVALPDGTTVQFRHPLFRESLYEGISPPRRRLLHGRIADELLAAAQPDPDLVAYHLQRAGDQRAVEWLGRAGERAQRAYAWTTAVDRFTAALRLLEQAGADPAERGWLLQRIARLRRYADPYEALGLLEQAHHLAQSAGNATLEATTRFGIGVLSCWVGHLRHGLAEMVAGGAALATAPPVPPQHAGAVDDQAQPFERDSILAYWLALVGRTHEARQLLETLQEPVGGRMVEDCWAAANVAVDWGDPQAAQVQFARAWAFCQELGSPMMLTLTIMQQLIVTTIIYGTDQIETRRRQAADTVAAWQRASPDVAAQLPHLPILPLLFVEGRWTEARQIALGVRDLPNFGLIARIVLAPIALATGDHALARSLVETELPDGPTTEPGNNLLYLLLSLSRVAASLALEEHQRSAAADWLRAHDRWIAWSGNVVSRAEGALAWAAYYAHNGELIATRDRASEAVVLASTPRQPLVLIAAQRTLGECQTALGAWQAASAALTTALALANACEVPYERGLTLLALANLRLALGDTVAALALLTEARPILAGLNAAPALTRLDTTLAQLGQTSHIAEAPLSSVQALTNALSAREREVLRLIAGGKSNREIAAILGLSLRTIERHITNLYTKIAATSKAEATAWAFRHGLA